MSRDITPFGLRMPTELKNRVDQAAADNGRSINSEVLDRLNRSFESKLGADLSGVPDGVLLDEVIARYGARQVQILLAPEVIADTSNSQKKPRAK